MSNKTIPVLAFQIDQFYFPNVSSKYLTPRKSRISFLILYLPQNISSIILEIHKDLQVGDYFKPI